MWVTVTDLQSFPTAKVAKHLFYIRQDGKGNTPTLNIVHLLKSKVSHYFEEQFTKVIV